MGVWWGIRGPIHWELLPKNCTITADLYCEQLDRLAAKLKGKQDKVYFLHDNARPHVARVTREKILALRWITIPYPPYSSDLSPSDYHLFRSLYHQLKGKKYDDEDHLKADLQDFFDDKSEGFYHRGIMELPDRWRLVVESNGSYIP